MSVKSIRFSGEITSNGIVNFDDGNAKWLLRKAKKDFSAQLSHNNIKIAKHAYIEVGKDEKGEKIYEAVLKISKDCIRQGIFKEDQPNHNPGIVYSKEIFNKFLASTAGLVRGYLFADEGIKRKSSVFISDAVQSSKNISTIDVGTMNTSKDKKIDADSESGLSLHYKETISGFTTYKFEGAIDLSELQFISTCETYDRKAIDPNYMDFYISELEKTVGGKVDTGFYIKNTASNSIPEQGIHLNSEQVKVLVERFFEKLFDLEIFRGASGRAWLSDLKVMFKENGINNGEYHKFSSANEIVKNIEVCDFYTKYNEEEALKLYQDIDTGKSKKAAIKKGKKDKAKKVNEKTNEEESE